MNAIIIVLIVVVGLTSADYLYFSRRFQKINSKIAEDPTYLEDKEKWTLCNEMLKVGYIRPMGIFSIIQMRRLQKSLDQYHSR